MEIVLPITAFIAIAIFIIKEAIEGFKAKRTRENTKKTVSLLLAYELELNFWSVKHFFHLLSKLEKIEHLDDVTLTLRKGIESNYSVKIEKPNGEFTGQAVPPFHHSRFNTLTVQVAELGEETYKKVQEAYSSLNELEDYRSQALNLFAGNEWLSEPEGTLAFLGYKSQSYNEFYSKLNEAYICLTGNQLKEHRLD